MTASVSSDAPAQERADLGRPGHIGAPFDGVVSPLRAVGDLVEAGEVVATIEAMKMEAAITTPMAGTVERVALDGPRSVEGGDLIVVVTADGGAPAAPHAGGRSSAATLIGEKSVNIHIDIA